MVSREGKVILEMKGIVKTFPGVRALKGVDFCLREGEVHAVLGENGAGKSTLMKCLAGIYRPTSGNILFRGENLRQHSVAQAINRGISMITQELSPVPHRSIMENIWLGREPQNQLGFVDHRTMRQKTIKILQEIDLNQDPLTLIGSLSVAQTQMIEIAKAVSRDAKIIIMDEPTSALTEKEVEHLFEITRRLQKQNKAIVYISHKLDEIHRIANRISVYRDGEYVGTRLAAEVKIDEMIAMMVGRNIKDLFPKIPCPIGKKRLVVKNLSHPRFFKKVSFSLREGEILGFAGLVGAGRTEVIESIFGLNRLSEGEIWLNGQKREIKSPRQAIAHKIALLTEDRRETGIFPMLTIRFNEMIAGLSRFIGRMGFVNHKKIGEACREYVKKIRIKTPDLFERIDNLSGGNQQKVLVARWLMTEPDILFLDEPTRGIDVGAKAEIHRLISILAGQGKSIIMVSSELPEILGMSDRIVIMHEGVVTGILDNNKSLTQDEVMAYATGIKVQDSQS